MCAKFALTPTFEDREMQFNTEYGPLGFDVCQLIVAGWTGRDAAAVQRHIHELAEIGVAPPSEVPLFYRVSNTLLTTESEIQVLGEASSGEAEPLLIKHDDKLWLGLGSDHTDRKLEATSVAASKQVCQKPCAFDLWDFAEIEDRLDSIAIKSWIKEHGEWVLYQDGQLSQIRPLHSLLDKTDMQNGSAMLCGTFAAIGGVRPASQFRATMADPMSGAELTLEYTANCLPDIR